MIKWLDKLEEMFVAITLLFTSVLVTVNVVIRAFGYGTMWSEELIRYLLIWVTFIGVSFCVRSGGHISIEFVPEMLKGKSRFILEFVIQAISIIFSILLTWYSAQFVYFNYTFDQLSTALYLPMFVIYLAIPIAGVLMSIRYIMRIMNLFKEKQIPEEENSQMQIM